MRKRIASIAVVLTLIINMLTFTAEAALPVLPENTAYARLDKKVESVNIKEVTMGEGVDPVYDSKMGYCSWMLDVSDSTRYDIYVDLDDSFAYNVDDGSTFDIEIEYYSQGSTFFNVHYDCETQVDRLAKIVYVGKNENWEKVNFTLDDALFANRIKDKYDLRLTALMAFARSQNQPATVDVLIKSIKVTRNAAAQPIKHYGWTDVNGNVFEWFNDEKLLCNEFTNTTDRELSADVTFYAIGDKGFKRWEHTEKITVPAREKLRLDVNFDSDICDLYTLYVDVVNKEENINLHFKRYIFAVFKTDPDGILNDKFLVACHISRYAAYGLDDDVCDLIKKTNISGIRQEFHWPDVEPGDKTGTFGYYEPWPTLHKHIRDAGLTYLPIFMATNWRYTGGFRNIPVTEPALKRWGESIEYICGLLKGWITRVEVWNEPNIGLFNGGKGGSSIDVPVRGDGYAKAAKVAIDAVKKVDPNIKVGVMALCDITSTNAWNYYREAMDTGLYKYADAISLHPYGFGSSESRDVAGIINKYRDYIKKDCGYDGEIEFWNTETGFTETDAAVGDNHENYVTRNFMYLDANNLSDCHVAYSFEDSGILTKIERENRFGMVRPCNPGTYDEFQKPFVPYNTAVAVAAMNYFLAKSEPDGNGNYGTNEKEYIYKYKSEKFGCDVTALWSDGIKQNVTLDLGVNKITYSDNYGNTSTLTSKDGKYPFLLTDEPIYLIGNLHKIEHSDEKLAEFPTETFSATVDDEFTYTYYKSDSLADCKITVNPSFFLTQTESTDMGDGNTRVSFATPAEFDGKTRIEQVLENDSGVLSRFYTTVDINPDCVGSAVTLELADGKDYSRWNGVLKISNESNVNVAKGYVEFTSPESFAKLGKIDIGRVPRGKNAEIRFSHPYLKNLEMVSVSYNLYVNDTYKFTRSQRVDSTVSAYAEKPITVDAYLDKDEWAYGTEMIANNVDQVRTMLNPWGGVDDLSCELMTMWDEKYFYLGAMVTDDIQACKYENGTQYNGDDIQFAIYHDKNSYIAIGNAGGDFNEFGIAMLDDFGPMIYKWKVQTTDTKVGDVTEGMECAVRRDGNKTYYELKMEWNTIFGYEYTPKTGDFLGFSYFVNDNDGYGRKQGIAYGGGIAGSKDANLFAQMRFLR